MPDRSWDVMSLDTSAAQQTQALALQLRHGFTRSEAEVALALAGGQSLNAIAAARALSIHTIRNQVKSAMTKAQVHRQVDLALLIARTPR